MIPILTPDEVRAIDAEASEPVDVLIGRAGWAVARRAMSMLGGGYGRTVNLVAGRGNNGNDGRVAADHLRRRGVRVREFDAAGCPPSLPPADLLVDAAYGTGFRGRWDAPDPGTSLVLAVDIPSGVDALTGEADGPAIDADATVTFQGLKPGLVIGRGAVASGQVEVADIGLDASRARAHLIEGADVAAAWPVRATDAHKWRGAVRIVAGSDGMPGAARLCAAAAGRAGAGLVSLSTPGVAIDARDEIVTPAIPGDDWSASVLGGLDRFAALVVGPGVGRAEATVAAVRRTVADAPVPVVVDGDGLFAMGAGEGAAAVLRDRAAPTVLTPHDGEFELLAGCRPGPDRFDSARRLAEELGCIVLLKGPTTLVADADGSVLAVDHGDQRLATAGTGDVLSGVVAAALARGVEPPRAAAAAAWLHADAGRRAGAAGLLAGDLVDALPITLAGLWDSVR